MQQQGKFISNLVRCGYKDGKIFSILDTKMSFAFASIINFKKKFILNLNKLTIFVSLV